MPCPSGSRILPTSASNGGVAPASVSDRSVSSSTCTKHTSLAVAAVIILAAAAASGSTPGPFDAAWISSRSNARSRSAANWYWPRARTALGGRAPDFIGRSRSVLHWSLARGASLVDPFPQRGRHGAGAVTYAELAVDRAEMTLDGLVADHQLGGDGTVGQPIDDERQDLALPLRQPLTGAGPELVAAQPRRGVHRPCRHAGVDRGLAAVHELELAHQLVAADALQQVSRRADAQRLKQVLLVVVDRQHHDLALRVALTQLKAQVQTAGTLHAHIAQHDVGAEVLDHAERPLSADGLTDHLHAVGERREHGLEALDDHLVVVDQHKAHRRPASINSPVAALSPSLRLWAQPVGRHGTTLELAFHGLEELGLADPPIGGRPMAVMWATL